MKIKFQCGAAVLLMCPLLFFDEWIIRLMLKNYSTNRPIGIRPSLLNLLCSDKPFIAFQCFCYFKVLDLEAGRVKF